MKRAAGLELLTGLLQLYPSVDDIDDVNPIEQLIDKLCGDFSCHSCQSAMLVWCFILIDDYRSTTIVEALTERITET
jgi:hypothetical protein